MQQLSKEVVCRGLPKRQNLEQKISLHPFDLPTKAKVLSATLVNLYMVIHRFEVKGESLIAFFKQQQSSTQILIFIKYCFHRKLFRFLRLITNLFLFGPSTTDKGLQINGLSSTFKIQLAARRSKTAPVTNSFCSTADL